MIKILIVDDSLTSRRMLTGVIRSISKYKEAEISEAINGIDVLEKVEKAPVDLIICDVNMPEMGGRELMGELLKKDKPIRIGFVSSLEKSQLGDILLEEGAAFVFQKPVNQETIKSELDKIFKGK